MFKTDYAIEHNWPVDVGQLKICQFLSYSEQAYLARAGYLKCREM